ncbi:MAG: hypothetical protein AB7E81_04080 [Hyphomicrobiaceae bacterium]
MPSFADPQRMVMLLLAERASADARVLIIGAGGGLEIKVFAAAQPGPAVRRVQLLILAPEDDEQLLRDAEFSGVSLFYVGFAFRGWVAYA